MLVLCESIEDAGTFWKNIVAQICGIYPWVGGYLFLVQRLDCLQGILGRVAELLVALNLQGGEVEQAWSVFSTLFVGYIRYRKVFLLNGLEKLLALLL